MTIYFPPPCYVQGRQPLDQSALCHMQPGLECLQGWGIHNLQGQPVPVPHHPLGEKLPPNIQRKPPLSQFKTIPPCPVTIHPCKQLFPLLFICSLQILEDRNEVSPQPSLLQAKQSQFPQPFLIGEMLQAFDHLALGWQRKSEQTTYYLKVTYKSMHQGYLANSFLLHHSVLY